MVLEWILAATIVVSLISFVGVFLLRFKEQALERVLFYWVAFAAGTLLGAAFLDLLPEASAGLPPGPVFSYALVGLLAFFLLEKIVHWHHHRGTHRSHEKPLAYLNVVGDGVHNFFDGVAIAASFMVGQDVGIATSLAVILHEIPQELGDYGLLVYSGFSSNKALFFNFLSALTAVLGALAFYFFSSSVEGLKHAVLAFTGGMFIYIAAATLLPEFQKELEVRKSLWQFGLILLGIVLIGLVASVFE